jgi:RNA polymerase sigma-70 factor, ECF subfamily
MEMLLLGSIHLTIRINTISGRGAGSPENALYDEWQKATSTQDREDILGKMYPVLKRHVETVIWGKLQNSDPDLAHDIVQTVLTGLDKFRGNSQFSTWVESIARNKCVDEIRRRQRRREHIDDNVQIDDLEASDNQPRVKPDAESSAIFGEAWGNLTAEDRDLLDKAKEGWTPNDVAKHYDITPSAAESRIRRAKQRAAEILQCHRDG